MQKSGVLTTARKVTQRSYYTTHELEVIYSNCNSEQIVWFRENAFKQTLYLIQNRGVQLYISVTLLQSGPEIAWKLTS